jgi:hypothetical protein
VSVTRFVPWAIGYCFLCWLLCLVAFLTFGIEGRGPFGFVLLALIALLPFSALIVAAILWLPSPEFDWLFLCLAASAPLWNVLLAFAVLRWRRFRTRRAATPGGL